MASGDIDARGRLLIAQRSDDFWATMLEVVPSLDRDHRIHRRRLGHPPYRCVPCGDSTDDTQLAALHQLGASAVRLIAHIHHLPLPRAVQELGTSARDRDHSRWTWLD